MSDLPSPQLLVSVRSADEARAALAGGADLIDVKEPTRGPLGAADPPVIRDVIAAVNGRVPVSAAFGEWHEWTEQKAPPGLHYAKWGLARLTTLPAGVLTRIRMTDCAFFPVLVAYADHGRAQSPDPEWLAGAAVRFHFPAFLIDTAVKDGSTLLDWIAPATLARIRFDLGDAGVPVALAGSLDESAIRTLGPLAPDWFGVRGAACTGGGSGTVGADRVRQLKEVIGEASRTNAG
jgi:uncharacterized protein (UPF0264 family)